MKTEYSENAVLKVSAMVGVVILAVIAGCAYCVGKVLDKVA